MHECVEHDHNLVIVEDYSASWSSDDDDRSTTSSLDKVDSDDSCSDDIATISPSTPSHCFMSQGDKKVSNANVIEHVDSNDELISRLASMTMSLENEKAKTLKLEKKTHF